MFAVKVMQWIDGLAEPVPPDGDGGAGVLPDPRPVAPPGADQITEVISYLRWGAGAAIVAAFLGGLILFSGGRMADNHRFGRMGTLTMIAAIGAAFLYAVGWQVLNTFASA